MVELKSSGISLDINVMKLKDFIGLFGPPGDQLAYAEKPIESYNKSSLKKKGPIAV